MSGYRCRHLRPLLEVQRVVDAQSVFGERPLGRERSTAVPNGGSDGGRTIPTLRTALKLGTPYPHFRPLCRVGRHGTTQSERGFRERMEGVYKGGIGPKAKAHAQSDEGDASHGYWLTP